MSSDALHGDSNSVPHNVGPDGFRTDCRCMSNDPSVLCPVHDADQVTTNCDSDTPTRPEPVFVLDPDTLLPTGVIAPCPSRFLAVLGFPEPTWVPCASVEGHDGPHYYRAEWEGDGDVR